MGERVEKQIKQIKEVCCEVFGDDDIADLIKKLRTLSKGSAFFEWHILCELLDVVQQIPDEDPKKIEEILIYVNEILHNSQQNFPANLSKVYKFVAKFQGSLELQRIIIETIAFDDEPISNYSVMQILLGFNLQCFTYEQAFESEKSRAILVGNIRLIMKNAPGDTKSQVYLIEILQNLMLRLNFRDKELGNEVLIGLSRGKMNITEDEAFLAYITLLSNVCVANPTGSSQFSAAIDSSLSKVEHKKANNILQKSLSLLAKELIQNKDLMEIRELFKKSDKSANVQKVALVISKIMRAQKRFEISSSCFAGYHALVYELLHVLAKVKNEANVYACCSDVKRHEIFMLVASIFPFVKTLVRENDFTVKEAKYLDFHLAYILQICNELNCDGKKKSVYMAYGHVYNTFYYMHPKRNDLMMVMAQEIDKGIKSVFKIYELLTDEDKEKSENPYKLVMDFLTVPFEADQAPHIANSLVRCLSFQVRNKDVFNQSEIMKHLFLIRTAVRKYGLQGAFQYIGSKKSEKEINLSIDELTAYEICAINRFVRGEEATVQIGGILTNIIKHQTLDMKCFAIICQISLERALKNVDLNQFKKLNEKLEKYSEEVLNSDIQVNLALGNNFYTLYQLQYSQHRDKFTQSDNKEIRWGKYSKIVEEFKLEEEIELLNFLEESLSHFSNAALCIRNDEKARQKIVSNIYIQRIIDNISINFLVRGIEHKEIEAQTVLWNFFNEDSSPTMILSSATIFLDNYSNLFDRSGNYIKFSKKLEAIKIDEVLNKSVESFKKLIDKFDEKTEKEQAIVINYLLSVWSYYLVKENKEEANHWYNKFIELWKLSNFEEIEQYSYTFNAKICFSAIDVNQKIRKNATNFLFDAVFKILKVQTVTSDFSNLFQFIYRRITTQAINYSLNRMADMDHYNVLMLTLKSTGLTRGYLFRSLEYISLSILRNLNMEKLDLAQLELKEFATLLGITEEVIVETPNKSLIVPNFDYEHLGTATREAFQQNELPDLMQSLSMQPNSTDLVDQLKSFIHSDKCKCEACKYSLLKFYFFQIGCHYSRFMWLVGKYNVSKEFNDFALSRWRYACQEIIRSKDYGFLSIKKKDFILFSIRWLFQVADTLIKLENYDEAEEIYREIELICTPEIYDYECMKQILHCRKESLEHMIKQKSKRIGEKQPPELSFEEFCRIRKLRKSKSGEKNEIKKPISTPSSSSIASISRSAKAPRSASSALRTPSTTSKKTSTVEKPVAMSVGKITRPKKPSPKDESVIFIDDSSDDDDKEKPAPKSKKASQKTPAITRMKATTSSLSEVTPKTSTSTRTRRFL